MPRDMFAAPEQADEHLDPDPEDFGAIDNDAYGRDDNDDSEEDDAERRKDLESDDHDQQEADDEEEELYWDGAPLESPTSSQDGEGDDTPLVKKLRQRIKEQQAELREISVRAPQQQQAVAQQSTLPPMPQLEDDGIDYDTTTYQQKLAEWYEKKAQHDSQQAQAQKQQEALVTTFNEKKAAYKERVAKLKVKGYDDAESLIARSLSEGFQTELLLNAERPELVVLALSRNPELMERAKTITSGVQLGMLIGEVQAKVKSLPKAKNSAGSVPSTPKGAGGSVVKGLEAELAKARNSGDYTRVLKLQKQIKAKK